MFPSSGITVKNFPYFYPKFAILVIVDRNAGKEATIDFELTDPDGKTILKGTSEPIPRGRQYVVFQIMPLPIAKPGIYTVMAKSSEGEHSETTLLVDTPKTDK